MHTHTETIDNIYAETYAQEQVRKELHALLEDPQRKLAYGTSDCNWCIHMPREYL